MNKEDKEALDAANKNRFNDNLELLDWVTWHEACAHKNQQITDLTNQLACRQKDYEAAAAAMVDRQDLYVKTKILLDEAIAENRRLEESYVADVNHFRTALSECQAREVKLRRALEFYAYNEVVSITFNPEKREGQLSEYRNNPYWTETGEDDRGHEIFRVNCLLADETVNSLSEDRSALDAMLAKHAHDKLMAFAQVCESIGEDIHGPGRNDSEAYDCADAARLMAEEQLKP